MQKGNFHSELWDCPRFDKNSVCSVVRKGGSASSGYIAMNLEYISQNYSEVSLKVENFFVKN